MGERVGLDGLLGLGLAPRTAYVYSRALARVSELLEARGVDLATCGPADVAAVAEAGFPASYSSRRMVRSALMAGWQVLDRLDGPVRAVRIPQKPRARSKALDEGSARALEAHAWGRKDDPGLAVLLGLYGALRRAEIARLRWEDVLADEHGRPAWLRVHGKGGLVAEVPVHPVLADALEERRRRAGWVFPGRRHSGPVKPETVWAWTRMVAVDAGLTDVPTHVLRHTALTEANDRSHDLRAVQEIARHARPETTAGYTRVHSRRLQEVIAMIDYGRAPRELGA